MNSQLQNRNNELARANNQTNKNFNKMQQNINKLNENINRRPAPSGDAIKRDELNELYDFVYKYDGTLGETALLFRENVKNYAQHTRLKGTIFHAFARICNLDQFQFVILILLTLKRTKPNF